ncbi:MAG: MFS transporter [Solirubrobacterales bacterium]|nr:MFS transporter [Solirubrobacterales bacterium]MBV8947478.1 MFS transporter [Solirubrobacterales bacterium]MBV9366550.1 MFS transporter [Solirubrobacterales bacterium]MBV9810263.1 MFS transporter [Solirubrobacterales bacterium]
MERKWWTLLVVCVGTFMLLLDITIVNVALPKIATDLKASFSDIQWVIDAYALTLASVLLTAGTLADRLGRRLLYSIGLVLFALTSLLCALSPSALFLILARGGQGIGGAIMFATALALLAQEFQGRERGTAFGIWGAAIAASAAVGPLLGGVLTEAFGWSSIFYVNVPVGIVAAALAMTKMRESKDPQGKPIDWTGTITFTGGLFVLMLAIIRGNSLGWGSTEIVALFAGAGVLLVAFLVSQFVQEQPMFDLSLFRKPTFSGASIVAFTLAAAMFAMFLYLTLYLQTLLGLSPLQTGLRFLPFTVVSFFVAAAAGRLSTRVPLRLLLGAGLGLTGLGLLLMRGLTPSSDWTALLPGFIVAGAGVGLVNPPLAQAAIGVVPPQRSGMASGINNTFRQVGTAVGIAVLGALFESRISHDLATSLARTPVARHASPIGHAVAGGGAQRVLAAVPATARTRASAAIHIAFVGAMNEILLVSAIVALTGAVLALLLIRGRDFATHGAPEPAAAAA